jgi:LemA protein
VITRAFAVHERSTLAYPQLQAPAHFADLRRDIADIENKVAAARRFVNMTVSEYNATLGHFPASFTGRQSGRTTRRFFDLGVERVFVEDAPVVKL